MDLEEAAQQTMLPGKIVGITPSKKSVVISLPLGAKWKDVEPFENYCRSGGMSIQIIRPKFN
jgi:hypothetical protein